MAELAKEWTTSAGVARSTRRRSKAQARCSLARSLEKVNDPCAATSPPFAVAPGQWQISLACKADLHSPDNSYSGVVQLECLDAHGPGRSSGFTVADLFGKHDWQTDQEAGRLAPGGEHRPASSCELQQDLWAVSGSTTSRPRTWRRPRARRPHRRGCLFATAQLGNLLFPDDSRQVSVTVEASKPLRDEPAHAVVCRPRLLGGRADAARHGRARTGREEGRAARLSGGRSICRRCRSKSAATTNCTPRSRRQGTSRSATTRRWPFCPRPRPSRYKPEEVPFTSRNWDNRISEYIRLSDRLGVRICGLWGGWSAKPPYKPEAPGLDLCRQLGMGWLTTTPIKLIERGKTEYDEAALAPGRAKPDREVRPRPPADHQPRQRTARHGRAGAEERGGV